MTGRKRTLDETEQELWDKVRRRVTPLHPHAVNIPVKQKEKNAAVKTVGAPVPAKAQRSTTQKIAPTAQKHQTPKPKATVRMDTKAHGQMIRGKLKPETRLDLHGMTADQAHAALVSFILEAHADGKRLVLVITGKGRNSRDDGFFGSGEGVLRRMVPHWLNSGVLTSHILNVSEAHFRHGGAGALYVYLRRRN